MSVDAPNMKKQTKDEKLESWWFILLIFYISLVISLTYGIFHQLPDDAPLTEDPKEFIAFKSRHILNGLAAAGPRVVGSKTNEITTVNYLLNQIELIAFESNGLYTIETDNQIVSGKFNFGARRQVYDSIQNVIVKLTSKNSTNTNALLINSHFDTVPTSPGAGDDGCMVAIMLGVLSSLTKSQETVRHPIIFLFNGDEENGLEAAHGFITQHKWAKDVKSVINLDGTGIRGKEILIQSGPKNNWLLNYYSKAAKHPHGNVMAREIYENPSFPSSNDFVVFREYGNLSGLNMVFYGGGFTYHTNMDTFSNLQDGSMQHAGDNVLALTRALGNAEELDEDFVVEPTGRAVYFDILGKFFVYYSENAGIIINSVIVVCSFIAIVISVWVISRNVGTSSFQIIPHFALLFAIQLGAVVVSAGVGISISFLLDYVGYSLSWLSKNWIMFGLYSCPYLFITGIIPAVFLEQNFFKRIPLKYNIMLLIHAQCIIFSALIILITCLEYLSAFLVTYTVAFYLVSVLINLFPGLHRKAHLWILPIVICHVFPLLLNSYTMHIIYVQTISLTARMPGNPDLKMAWCTLAFTMLLTGFITPIFSIFRQAKSIISIFILVFLLDFILVFTPIGFPYTEITPQRHIIFHTSRVKYGVNGEVMNRDPVFGTYLYDRHAETTLLDIATKNNLRYLRVEDNMEGLEFFRSGFGIIEGYELKLPNRGQLTLLSKEIITTQSDTYRYTFQIDGGAKTYRLFVRPLRSNKLIDWSFRLNTDALPLAPQPEYNANLQFGKSAPPYTFWIDLKLIDPAPSTLVINLFSQYLDEENELSDGLNRFLEYFPNWTTKIGYICSFDSYEF